MSQRTPVQLVPASVQIRLVSSNPVATAPSDAELIGLVITKQNMDAYGELILRHQEDVRRLLFKLCRGSDHAQDLAQETFIHAQSRLGQLQNPLRLRAWLLQIAYRFFLQAQRNNKRFTQVSHAFHLEQDGATEPITDTPDLPKMLACLAQPERSAIIMFHGLGMTHIEVADVLEIPLGTVKSHIKRGKEKMRLRFNLPTNDACVKTAKENGHAS